MMRTHDAEVRRDKAYGARELASFLVGSLPLVLSLFVTGVLMRSAMWSLASVLFGLPAAFLIMRTIARDPTCSSCGKVIRQESLDTDTVSGKLSYYCADCNIRWVTDLNAPGYGSGGGL